ncbi:hypothetical protein VQL36_04875 [Chengkuizengella sp. SCS-71B]|uniref:hypothetical protein n=1 Tax=Chengkuizengella sp. SCS-71B TaxID=3115290 RepID=UPI0032C21079
MAEKSSFFNSVDGDRQYDMEVFATYFKQFLTSGLYHQNHQPSLGITHVSGLQTKLETGSAYLEGFMYENTEEMVFIHDAADATNPRIDRIVLKLDRDINAREIKAGIKKGVPATTPLPPILQRDDIVYEMSLAQIKINAGETTIHSITDERFNEEVCGLVSSLITVPTDELQRQWNEWFSGVQNEIGARILIGDNEPQNAITGDIWIKSI